MRTTQLQLKLYKHQIKSIAKKHHEEELAAIYEAVYEQIACVIDPVLYHDYNLPSYQMFAGVLCLGNGPSMVGKEYQNKGLLKEEKILLLLLGELLQQADHSVRELIRLEKRCRVERLNPVYGTEAGEMLSFLRKRWPDLPPFELDTSCVLILSGKLGAQFGCSNGGSCQSCTSPTCGYRAG